MKRQKAKWACGAAVVRNTLRVFGQKENEHVVRSVAGTTKEFGTSEHGIMDALDAFGYHTEEHHFDCQDEAWEWLHETLQAGYPVILAVEAWEHWVIALGSLGDLGVCIFDSSNFKVNTYENGTHIWDRDKLMYMWYNARKSIDDETESRIYAISVWKE